MLDRETQNLKNAAQAILKCKYPEDVRIKMQSAFDEEKYSLVMEIAAQNDVAKRNSLDARISMIPNPNYVPIDQTENLEESIENLDRPNLSPKDIKTGKIYEVDEKIEPKFLFVVEGVDGKFKTAAKAAAALSASKPDKKHSFKRNPKFVTIESSPEEIAAVLPKVPTVQEQNNELPKCSKCNLLLINCDCDKELEETLLKEVYEKRDRNA